MAVAAVLFDLFGTLVPSFRYHENRAAVRTCAEILQVDFEEFHTRWSDMFIPRIRGDYDSIAATFKRIATEMNTIPGTDRILNAAVTYETYTASSLTPVPGALEVLEWLVERDVRIALVTNCAPDIPRIWRKHRLAPLFQHCAFSCSVGATKPEEAIYRSALKGLGVRAEDTWYVGDGSDEELTGAAKCGLRPVLVKTDLSNTYDSYRRDVAEWDGDFIESLIELPGLIESEFTQP